MQKQLSLLVDQFIAKNNIQINKEELKFQLLSHPSYPSLHSITGVLDHFSIPNLAVDLAANKNVLDQLPNCFIAGISIEGGNELILVEKTKNFIKITHDNKVREKLSEKTFLEKWSGIIVALEKDDSVAEEKTSGSFKFLKWTLILTAFLITGAFVVLTPSIFSISHFLLSLLGFTLSVLIVKHELGIHSSFATKVCNLSEQTSCDAVLNSKGANFLGLFKLSDLSLIVFGGYMLAWLLYSVGGIVNTSLFLISSLAGAVFVMYSIYYQAVVVKKWCPLCLCIGVVLLLQFGFVFTDSTWYRSVFFDANTTVLFGIGYVLLIGAWSFLKPLISKNTKFDELEVLHYKFKRNYAVFNTLSNTGSSVDSNDKITGEIVLGNPNAPIEIILVTSPLCFYCKAAHSDIEKIFKAAKDQIKVTFRFMADPENKESLLYKSVSELLHSYHTQGEEETWQLLHDLYSENSDIASWIKNRNIHYNPGYDNIMKAQKEWCNTNEIHYTPELFVNDKPFPKEYNRSDLLFFVDEIINEKKMAQTSHYREAISL